VVVKQEIAGALDNESILWISIFVVLYLRCRYQVKPNVINSMGRVYQHPNTNAISDVKIVNTALSVNDTGKGKRISIIPISTDNLANIRPTGVLS